MRSAREPFQRARCRSRAESAEGKLSGDSAHFLLGGLFGPWPELYQRLARVTLGRRYLVPGREFSLLTTIPKLLVSRFASTFDNVTRDLDSIVESFLIQNMANVILDCSDADF